MGLTLIAGHAVMAANVYIVLCAFAGGLSFLLYRRWVGWLPATAGGLLYLFLPDNVRVALAEGNLPRVLTAALLPLTVYFLLRSLEKDGTRWHWIALALCFAGVTLSHAMIAAIFAVCSVALALIVWVGRATTLKRVVLAGVSVALGLLLSGWWLLPSLTGGITELNSEAMTEAQPVFSLVTYLNPTERLGNPEIVYPGAMLLVISAALLLVKRGRNGWNVGLTVVGLLGVLISTSGFNTLFNALPGHHLLWPIRFLNFATFALLLAVVWRAREARQWLLIPALLALALLLVDNAGSLHLVHLRPPRSEVAQTAERLPELAGWREATLDYGKLGSAPTYFYTSISQREQLYGWAYQGARTATNVAAVNEALEQGYAGYLVDRLTLYGADDIVLLRYGGNDVDVESVLAGAGFSPSYAGSELALFHRDGAPRAYVADWTALGVGRGAQNLSYLFPEIVRGSHSQIDDYTFEELSAFDTLVLSGFEWRDRSDAEELVCRVANTGTHIVIDLTGTPMDPWAREPRFLDVWGEHIALGPEAIVVQGNPVTYELAPFSAEFPYWQTHTPQGLDETVLYHDYLGNQSAAVGYRECGDAQVWFVGLNLPYHAALTQDPAAIELLEDVLEMRAGEPHEYTSTPLYDYRPTYDGYHFSYTLDAYETLVVPVAHHEGTVVEVDGSPARVLSFDNLVAFDAPAGSHYVAITVASTPIYAGGKVASGLGVLGLFGLTLVGGAGTPSRRKDESHDEER